MEGLKNFWNMKIRAKSPTFWMAWLAGVAVAVLAYMNVQTTDITSWQSLADVLVRFISNPYLVGLVIVQFIQTTVDTSTAGFSDSTVTLIKKDIKETAGDVLSRVD